MNLISLNKFTDPLEIPSFLEECSGRATAVGLLSDAGCPGVADPGAEVVKIAHKQNIQVIPLVGAILYIISDDELWNERSELCI